MLMYSRCVSNGFRKCAISNLLLHFVIKTQLASREVIADVSCFMGIYLSFCSTFFWSQERNQDVCPQNKHKHIDSFD